MAIEVFAKRSPRLLSKKLVCLSRPGISRASTLQIHYYTLHLRNITPVPVLQLVALGAIQSHTNGVQHCGTILGIEVILTRKNYMHEHQVFIRSRQVLLTLSQISDLLSHHYRIVYCGNSIVRYARLVLFCGNLSTGVCIVRFCVAAAMKFSENCSVTLYSPTFYGIAADLFGVDYILKSQYDRPKILIKFNINVRPKQCSWLSRRKRKDRTCIYSSKQ